MGIGNYSVAYFTFAKTKNLFMPKTFSFCFLIFSLCFGCKNNEISSDSIAVKEGSVLYAESFDIIIYENYKVISVKKAWPDADRDFKYALVKKGTTISDPADYDAVVTVPIQTLAATSTTHLPSLEMLNKEESLVGFAELDFISSEKIRMRIASGKVTELGRNEALNTEALIDLAPEAVVGFAMDGINTTYRTIQNAGIPVLYNADWTETSPLGKAEWIKFFGALFDKDEEADQLFESIKNEYEKVKALAQEVSDTPEVLYGAMYRDIWHVPRGDSWGAQFIEDANGNYLWKDEKGTGGLSLSLETVLDKAQQADIWLAPAQFSTLGGLEQASQVYTIFDAFKNKKVYNYTAKKGATGGYIYFELAPNRPDLVLKDLVKIFHPELLPEHELYFYSQLK